MRINYLQQSQNYVLNSNGNRLKTTLMISKFKAVLFDHDGTLVDSEGVHYQLWQSILLQHKVELSSQFYADVCAGVPSAHTAQILIDEFKLDYLAIDLLRDKRAAEQTQLTTAPFPLMPFVREVVEGFARQHKLMAVVTGAPFHAAQRSLTGHDLDVFIPRIFSGQDTPRNKPAPDCYLAALDQLKITAAEAIAFEDTEHGVRAAVDAGITCFAIPHSLSKGQDFSRATAIFDNLQLAYLALQSRLF
jgi:HAD superfamily hydrolase (TIGR01509 family)